MCTHDPHPTQRPRYGSSLAHGPAHTGDHRRWSRRDFLGALGATLVGNAFVFGGTPVQAFGRSPLLRQLQQLETDRILVLIQLNGGNDGLNTIIPVENSLYYNLRPDIAIPKANTIALSDQLGMHPGFEPLGPFFDDGRMAVLQNVGYPDPDLSHFRSTDIWVTASDTDEILTTGWAGRYLGTEYPDFEEALPETPLAVQLGAGSSTLLQGPDAYMGMSLASPELFERIAQTGIVYETTGLPDTTYGEEMTFVRTVANDSFQYAGAIQAASSQGQNQATYPNDALGNNLSIVARLIKGALGSRIYHLSLGSFDTHANQLSRQATLLRSLAENVQAFHADLAAAGLTDRVLVMTFSEFGRRVRQNASGGTDHGTAAPLMLFGDGLNGGLYGSPPDLDDLDRGGNLKFELDFRSVYSTVLQDWFGLPPQTTAGVLGGAFPTLSFVADPATPTATDPSDVPQGFHLAQNYPNPFNPTTIIPFSLDYGAPVRLQVFDVQGRLVRTLLDRTLPAGDHRAVFEANGLSSGPYFYRLQTPDGSLNRKMMLVR